MSVPQTEIIITKGYLELGRHTLTPGEYVLGREGDISVQVDLVSRRHAKLTLNADHAFIEDLGSSNGTLVNGKPVKELTRLWPNQKIQIGSAVIELRRIKTESSSDLSLAPMQQVVRRVLPEEFLREKKYDIGGVIAQGGMGAILDAKEATIERTVAMKVSLNTTSPDDLMRFVNEAKITGQLEHPNIVPVHELNVDENGQVFYTMKMVKGDTLQKTLELTAQGVADTVKKYPLAVLLTVFQKVCDALAFAHSKGVIHRDLKPENIMIGDYGEVLVMDWGLAKRLDGETGGQGDGEMAGTFPKSPNLQVPESMQTLAGSVMGTPQFMAPEQARGEVASIDARSDIYSLGAILYQILSLRLSVNGRDAWDIVGKVGRGEIEPLTAPVRSVKSKSKTAALSHLPGGELPASLSAVVRKAMAHSRTGRYQTVPELQADIEAYQNGFATGAEKAGVWKQLKLFVKRHKAVATATAAAFVIIAAVIGVAFLRVNGEKNTATKALAELKKTAPTFAAIATGLVEQGKLEDAVEKIGYAVSLEGNNPDYLLQQANLLQANEQLAAAAESYRRVLALRAGPAAKLNLELCEKLLRDNAGSAQLNRESQELLVNAMIKQGRHLEAAPLSSLLGKGSDTALAAIIARLKPIAAFKPQVIRLPNGTGTFSLTLNGQPVLELPPLNGLHITEVSIWGTKITDLSPLKGLRLRSLNIAKGPVTDLSPLAGMPLETLFADVTKISDLTPLRGMPLTHLSIPNCSVTNLHTLVGMSLEELNINNTVVNDLSPLAGMPLKSLNVGGTQIKDLRQLAGMPLRVLELVGTRVSDLSPLTGMPLEELNLTGTQVTDITLLRTIPLKRLFLFQCPVKDLSPLANCKTLESLTIPKVTTDISFLRALPNLRRLNDGSAWPIPAEQFWDNYDKKRATAPK